jgi:hypothetical protein
MYKGQKKVFILIPDLISVTGAGYRGRRWQGKSREEATVLQEVQWWFLLCSLKYNVLSINA